MRGWSSIAVGFLLLSLAFWSYVVEGFGASTLICIAGAGFFFFRGAQGLSADEAGDLGDATAVIEFVSNPAGAIVDTATDRIGDWLKNDEPKAAAGAEQTGFDPDAAVARYLAQRGSEPAGAPAGLAPPRGFGRKGV